jgi:hypothetical protein
MPFSQDTTAGHRRLGIGGLIQWRCRWRVDPEHPATRLGKILDEGLVVGPDEAGDLVAGVAVDFDHLTLCAFGHGVGALDAAPDAVDQHFRELGQGVVGKLVKIDPLHLLVIRQIVLLLRHSRHTADIRVGAFVCARLRRASAPNAERIVKPFLNAAHWLAPFVIVIWPSISSPGLPRGVEGFGAVSRRSP